MYRAADSVPYIPPDVGAVLEQHGVPAGKLHHVPMWADEAVFHASDDALRGELGLDDDQIVLLYGGALRDAQGLHSLIDTCAKVIDPRFVAIIAGSGWRRAACESRPAEPRCRRSGSSDGGRSRR